jgi:hypothetical protein
MLLWETVAGYFENYMKFINALFWKNVGRDSPVDIATSYQLNGSGIESRWGRDFPHPSRPTLGPTQPPIE